MAITKMSNKRLVVEWSLPLDGSVDDRAKLFARLIHNVPHVELLQITPQSGNGCTLWARLPAEDGSDAVALGAAVAALGLPESGVTSRVETVASERLGIVSRLKELAIHAPVKKAGPIWQAALRIAEDEHTIARLRERLRKSTPIAFSGVASIDG